MTQLHLPTVVACADLPVEGQLAAVQHPDLHPALALNPALSPDAFRAIYQARRPPSPEVAISLVSRPLPDDLVRHVAEVAREMRPAVIGALAAMTAPQAPDLRAWVLQNQDPDVAETVLSNPAWEPAEQARVAVAADGEQLLRWLATLDPRGDAAVVDAVLEHWLDVRRDLESPGPEDRLDARATVVAMQAAVRWPAVLEVPLERMGHRLRAVTATLTTRTARLHALLDKAEELHAKGFGVEATSIVEAVALNPYASLRVQRRAARLSRTRMHCHYLAGFRPAISAGPGDGEMDELRQSRFLNVLERNVHARHRTVWSAVQLGLGGHQLTRRASDRLVAHLIQHGRAAGLDRATGARVCDRLDLTEAARAKVLRPLWDASPCAAPVSQALAQLGVTIDLEGSYTAQNAEQDTRALARALSSEESWQLAMVLLRDGWDRGIDELGLVVGQLVIEPAA